MGKELLFAVTEKDLIIQPFKASGPGGQHKNKNATAIRIIHKASGAMAEASDSRSQYENKRNALKRLSETTKFKTWVKIMAAEIVTGESLEEKVKKMVEPQNLKVEVRDEKGKWKTVNLQEV